MADKGDCRIGGMLIEASHYLMAICVPAAVRMRTMLGLVFAYIFRQFLIRCKQ